MSDQPVFDESELIPQEELANIKPEGKLRQLNDAELAELRGDVAKAAPVQEQYPYNISKHAGSNNHNKGKSKKALKTEKASRRRNRRK